MLRFAAIACAAMVLVACGGGGSTASATASAAPASSPSPSASPLPTLSAADLAQVAVLEKRPLRIPKAPPGGACNQGPFTAEIAPYTDGGTASEVYGAGPVYGLGSAPVHAGAFDYFDVTYFTDPTVRSVVLVRINDLSGKFHGAFVGPWGVGRSLGSQVIQGEDTVVHAELALPAENPPASNPSAAPGWGVWHVRQGIDARFTCAAIQIDTANKTEVILGH